MANRVDPTSNSITATPLVTNANLNNVPRLGDYPYNYPYIVSVRDYNSLPTPTSEITSVANANLNVPQIGNSSLDIVRHYTDSLPTPTSATTSVTNANLNVPRFGDYSLGSVVSYYNSSSTSTSATTSVANATLNVPRLGDDPVSDTLVRYIWG
jgi:hypothetical protein